MAAFRDRVRGRLADNGATGRGRARPSCSSASPTCSDRDLTWAGTRLRGAAAPRRRRPSQRWRSALLGDRSLLRRRGLLGRSPLGRSLLRHRLLGGGLLGHGLLRRRPLGGLARLLGGGLLGRRSLLGRSLLRRRLLGRVFLAGAAFLAGAFFAAAFLAGAFFAVATVSSVCLSVSLLLGFSSAFSTELALNFMAVEAGTFTAAPVWGLRPVRAARWVVLNEPKPGHATLSPVLGGRHDDLEEGVDGLLRVSLRGACLLRHRFDQLGLGHACALPPGYRDETQRISHSSRGAKQASL